MHLLRLFTATAAALCLSSACIPADLFDPPPAPPSPPPDVNLPGDRIKTNFGNLIIHPINHATLALGWSSKTIYVDPVGDAARFAGLPAANVILVTDVHADHLSAETLTALAIPNHTLIIAPQAVYDALPPALQAVTRVLANDATTNVEDLIIEARPMYNTTPERVNFHTKGRGNGYLLTTGDRRVYIAGDTEDIPEMRALRGIDVAFLPMNLPYTMTVQQAADAVREFKPTIVYPYHFRDSDLAEFSRWVGTDAGVEVRLREWY
ncbi:MBL fold metallo-hydrolase [Melittangium boletus]|uniref:MBL fold metallo-hydrolase n=1 Tax=Melittangium boletus DSM 14713 TaxID=1294270 RepID=A0A250IJC7_9BACT|nr:MBL fold metallo-hydrolase [Melittangium boletus]ATB31313.1 MBL fold metallo-hydrolase [Melittangium boletus DSM 14713]